MPMLPLVSAVIVNHNYGRYLGESIESVLAQTYRRIETIVVDDGSTDNSLEVLRAYSNRIAVISQSNKGPSAARNAGIARSTGEWIAFLDSDDMWLPEKIGEQSQYFHDDAVGIIFCGVEYIDDSGMVLGGSSDGTLEKDPLGQLATFTYPPIGASTAVVRADCLRHVRGFDEMLFCAEDLDLWIRVAAEYEVRSIRPALVKYRKHSGSLSVNVRRFEDNNVRMLNKLFSNPRCARVHHLRRQAYGKFYMILSGSYFRDGNLRQAASCALKAILYRPLEIGHVCDFPVRNLRRLMVASESRGPYAG
jgi:glycosyltransferase involved in cell wall biosynthesis